MTFLFPSKALYFLGVEDVSGPSFFQPINLLREASIPKLFYLLPVLTVRSLVLFAKPITAPVSSVPSLPPEAT
jgi:hypothetical protein